VSPSRGHYLEGFAEFTTLLQARRGPTYTFPAKQESYVLGQDDFRGIRFVAVNSAWFCKGDDDKNQLWVRAPHLRQMEADEQLQRISDAPPLPVVGLIHHPDEWCTREENSCISWQAAHSRLSCREMPPHPERAHPTEKSGRRTASPKRPPPDRRSCIRGRFPSQLVRVIRIKSDGLNYRSFEFDPRSSDNKWADRWGARQSPFC